MEDSLKITQNEDGSFSMDWDPQDLRWSWLNGLCNDKMALRVYGVLRSMGLRIPEDISVTGYDNYALIAETLFPALTTVELPYARMGVAAGTLLLDLIQSKTSAPSHPISVDGPVFWRSSVTDLFKSNAHLFQNHGRLPNETL